MIKQKWKLIRASSVNQCEVKHTDGVVKPNSK